MSTLSESKRPLVFGLKETFSDKFAPTCFGTLLDLRLKDRQKLHAVVHGENAAGREQRACHTRTTNLERFEFGFFHLAGVIKAGLFDAERASCGWGEDWRFFVTINQCACIQHRHIRFAQYGAAGYGERPLT